MSLTSTPTSAPTEYRSFEGLRIVLIAPNVGEQMGGEAIKALAIFRELRTLVPNVVQITHGRNREEVQNRLKLSGVEFVDDSLVSVFLWKSVVLRWFVDVWFGYKAVRLAERLLGRMAGGSDLKVVFQTEPNSPVLPRFLAKRAMNVFGPINGNIYLPPSFRSHENLKARLRRAMHFPAQYLNRWRSGGLRNANLVLVAGGQRTRSSLIAAGCDEGILMDSVDFGLAEHFFSRPRVVHTGLNLRFVHYGRLVFHKGTHLAIEALRLTRLPVELDIVGRGPELESLKHRTVRAGLSQRVRFKEWFPSHEQLLDSLQGYRGVLFPSLEDANGIVVQECMALGLPPICVDWGGPSLLIDHEVNGYLVTCDSEAELIQELARRLDFLAENAVRAEEMSLRARDRASQWRWRAVLHGWLDAIQERARQHGTGRPP